MQFIEVLRNREKEVPIKAEERYTGQEKEGVRKKSGSIPRLIISVPIRYGCSLLPNL